MIPAKTFSKRNFHTICDDLGAMDDDLGVILKEHSYPQMWSRPNTFETLVHFILEQQVSLASALSALNKLRERTGEITPLEILKLSDEEMRACYVSRQKMGYIRGIAEAIETRTLDLMELKKLSDKDVRQKLTALRGVGNWTADVYLMFVLQRTDVFPIGDLAAVNAIKRAKRLAKDTDRAVILEMAEKWKPHRTIATMILWHHYLLAPIKREKTNTEKK
jgi:DNA-3-methyladenine glycosylase II